MLAVRAATKEDLPHILAIENYEILNGWAHFGIEPLDIDGLAKDWESNSGRLPWLVAEEDGPVVGFARAQKWKPRGAYQMTVEIGVYVEVNHRGKGIASKLYSELFDRLKEAGVRTVVAGISLPNPASIRLHERLGMRHCGTLPKMGFKLGAWRDVGYWCIHFESAEGASRQ